MPDLGSCRFQCVANYSTSFLFLFDLLVLGTKLNFDYCLQILATKSPSKFYVEESESDASDNSDDLSLASALTTLRRKAVTPPPCSFPDTDDEIEDPSMGQLIADAMNTVNNMPNVSCNAFLLL